MVDRIVMDKGNNLGYGNMEGDLIGRAFGYDIYVEKEGREYMGVFVYDRNKSKRIRSYCGDVETRYRIAANIELAKERGAWNVSLATVDSRYKGRNLAVKIYKFLIKKMDITLMAGHSQSAGGRYLWNKLNKERDIVIYARKSPYSKIIDFPKSGKRELVSKRFDLYDSDAEIFAVAA